MSYNEFRSVLNTDFQKHCQSFSNKTNYLKFTPKDLYRFSASLEIINFLLRILILDKNLRFILLTTI